MLGREDPHPWPGSPSQEKRPSAVLMPLVDDPDGPKVLLTRRSWELRSHRGEVSFPGGQMDPGDGSLLATALRETEEEIGLPRSHIEIIGELDPLSTLVCRAEIRPFVGRVRQLPELVIQADEVDSVLLVPLVELLDPAIFREEIWTRDGEEIPITFFELEGNTLWGLTARILRNLFELLLGIEPTGRGSPDG